MEIKIDTETVYGHNILFDSTMSTTGRYKGSKCGSEECGNMGEVYYANGSSIVLCSEHVKFFRDVHGNDLKTKAEYDVEQLERLMSGQGLKRIASAMASPLKVNFDYASLEKTIAKAFSIDPGCLPVYDKDLPEPKRSEDGNI